MQNLLARLSAIGVIIGGFLFTGDVTRLAERGTRLINSRTIPSEDESRDPGPAVASHAGVAHAVAHVEQAAVASPAGLHPPAVPRSQPTGGEASPHDAPLGLAADVPPPDDGGAEAVHLAALQPGDRVSVWVAGPRSTAAEGHGRTMMIAFDMVDPSSGEALEQRHVATRGNGRPAVVLGSPRRVLIVGSGVPGLFDGRRPSAVTPGRIAKGETILYVPRTTFQNAGSQPIPETFGPVVAVQVTRPAAP